MVSVLKPIENRPIRDLRELLNTKRKTTKPKKNNDSLYAAFRIVRSTTTLKELEGLLECILTNELSEYRRYFPSHVCEELYTSKRSRAVVFCSFVNHLAKQNFRKNKSLKLLETDQCETFMLEAFDCLDHRNASQLTWGLGKLEYKNVEVYRCLSEALQTNLNANDFLAQHLANILWGYANASIKDENLFSYLANIIINKDPSLLNEIDLANILWAFSEVGIENEAVSNYIINEVIRRPLRLFSTRQLSSILWSLSVFYRSKNSDVVRCLIKELQERNLEKEQRTTLLFGKIICGQRPSRRDLDFVEARSKLENRVSIFETDVLKHACKHFKGFKKGEFNRRVARIPDIVHDDLNVEVDGDIHFVFDYANQYFPNGKTLLRNRVYEVQNVPFISIDCFEWINHSEDKNALLAEKFKPFGIRRNISFAYVPVSFNEE